MKTKQLQELDVFKTLSGIAARFADDDGSELVIVAANEETLKKAWDKITGGKLPIRMDRCQQAVVMSLEMPIFKKE